jgi:hypothetical protein
MASRLLVSKLIVHASAPYIIIGLIRVSYIIIFVFLHTDCPFNMDESAQYALLAVAILFLISGLISFYC